MPNVHGLVLPKLFAASDVERYEQLISEAEVKAGFAPGRYSFIPSVEIPEALFQAHDIAKASKRNIGLILGHGDLLAETHGKRTKENLWYTRKVIVTAARAANTTPIDTLYLRIDRPNGFMLECEHVKALG